MNNLKKGVWFPVSLVVLVVIIALWVPFRYGKAALYNRNLLKRGAVENAQISRKGILVDNSLLWVDQTEPSDIHQLHLKLPGLGSEYTICQLGVSKELYDVSPPGSRIPVTYLPESPQKCRLTASLPGTQSVMLFGISLSACMILFASVASFYIFRSYRKTGLGSAGALSTEIRPGSGMHCPECDADMEEGYLPMNRGIYWRNLDEPVGMPTLFSGLPGTISWLRRQRLHAYHCKICKIITFKYGVK